MQNLDEHSITDAVLERLNATPNARLKEVLTSLVHHLHDFARETRLSEDEWLAAIEFLTRTGQISGPTRQEFILLSDVFGLSMLVTAQNHRKPAGCTEATVFGPFHVEDAPNMALGSDIAGGAPGQPCYVDVSICGPGRKALAGATVEVWQSDANGKYDVQYPELDEHRARATLLSDDQGRVYFKSVLAEPYPIPHDGPVGQLLEASRRHPWRPAHLHFRITAKGYERLVTHVFRDDDRYLDSDVVFGVRSSLLAPWIEHAPGITPDGATSTVPFYTLHFDFVLNPTGTSA
jgi:hydroxyquinol 1,2-dioxygenase